ncbi:MaoC/PaaZ C-terminal domain-containing protein [Rhizobium lusitanum]|uniref:Acyl dehydratase n=1 Tax=Rhizobium lusitanum TaxID=293958 RepID=A0A1C3XEF7_9HYPH|nr:MaoC/PaaZ C-terminal domain-containing protein [Rhizobium lusitanum]NTJ11115.1 dehydratase [Rhizobium lusitanum]SCB50486.1 Acyl dehydratase [Rhizobium lusitanum]
MAISARSLMEFPIPEARQTVSARDAILYALSVGYGTEPLDTAHLRRVLERDLLVVPTLANVVAHAGPWMQDAGVNWQRLVHAEQRLTIHRPLPLDGPLLSRSRMLSIVDRGVDKGMFATFERSIVTLPEETPIASIVQTNACRGDGGCGSAGVPLDPLMPVPERVADAMFAIRVPRDAALLYRLNGDLNALHVDPAYAAQAGFPRPILHGLCTFGYAGYAIGRTLGAEGIADVGFIAARFTSVVFPGDRLEVDIWHEDREVYFRARVPERGVTALDYGNARLS